MWRAFTLNESEQKTSITIDNFWSHPYVREQNYRGRLALFYAIQHQEFGTPIIVEDMANGTGLHIDEVDDWLGLFIRQGYLNPEAVAAGQL
jgi:hypothetical protein